MTSPLDRLAAGLADRYRLERKLGEGGMASVWLAEDLRHRRKVAIKVVHPELSAVLGGERFLKEIELTASLQHPHILPLFDSGTSDGQLYYVMPFIEGESLRDRLERERQLPIPDAVRIAKQVAEALDYAHRRGIVHRDIKPENVLLHEGNALVADFGIALAVQQAGGSRLTQTGLSLGTPHYMSPEQAMGERHVDARADIYALGAMTYEMIAGEPPFTGATAQAIVAKVITEKPAPLASHRDTVPPQVAAAVHLALSKLAADRWPSAREFGSALDERGGAAIPAAGRATVALAAARKRSPAPWLIAGALALSSLALGVALGWFLHRPAAPVESRLEVFRGLQGGGGVAFSPDGRVLAVSSPDSAGMTMLYLRRLDRLQMQPIPGTESGTTPTFSPDGSQLAFIRTRGDIIQSSLWRVGLDGGTPVRLSDSARGGVYGPPSWSRDGYIYFVTNEGLLSRVPAAGGATETLAIPGLELSGGYGQPQALPNGKGVIVTLLRLSGGNEQHEVGVWDAKTRKVTTLVRGFSPRLYPDGHLLYVDAGGVLNRVKFDLERLRFDGVPQPVADHVRRPGSGIVTLAISPTGDFVYRSDSLTSRPLRRIVLVSRNGRVRYLPLSPDIYSSMRASPDGRQLAIEITEGGNDGGRIAIVGLGDSVPRQLSRKGINSYPVWSPDGRRIAYSRLLDGERDLVWQAADGSDTARTLLHRPGDQWQVEFVPGTDQLVVREGNANGGTQGLDIYSFRIGSDSAVPFAAQPKVLERAPRVSPDGRWVAYVSSEKGRDQVFVKPFPDPGTGTGYQVSVDGGQEPVWSRSGKELFFRAFGNVYSADIVTAPAFAVGARRRLFSATGLFSNPWHARYDVLPGDSTFVMIDLGDDVGQTDARTILVQHPTPPADAPR